MNNMFADDAELCAADLRCFLMRVIPIYRKYFLVYLKPVDDLIIN